MRVFGRHGFKNISTSVGKICSEFRSPEAFFYFYFLLFIYFWLIGLLCVLYRKFFLRSSDAFKFSLETLLNEELSFTQSVFN